MWNCLEFEREWAMQSMAEDQIDRMGKHDVKNDHDLVLGVHSQINLSKRNQIESFENW